MGIEQGSLFPEPKPEEAEQPVFDIDAVARHIGEHATNDPYAAYEARKDAIAKRKAATHTPETLPEHLRDTWDAAEAHFRDTAPGAKPMSAEEAIQKSRETLGTTSEPSTDDRHISLKYADNHGYFDGMKS